MIVIAIMAHFLNLMWQVVGHFGLNVDRWKVYGWDWVYSLPTRQGNHAPPPM